MKRALVSTAIMVAISLSGTAHAGGLVTDPPPPPVVPQTSFDWTGLYLGADVGFGTGEYGNDGNIIRFPGDGTGDLDGALIGISAGYSFQSGLAVLGGELNIAATDINGSEECLNPAFQCAVDIDRLGSLRAQAGYLLSPSTLVYGNVGVAVADVTVFTDDGLGAFSDDETLTGFTVGLGLERALTSHLSATVAVQFYGFEPEDYLTDVFYEDVDIDFGTLDIGLNYRF